MDTVYRPSDGNWNGPDCERCECDHAPTPCGLCPCCSYRRVPRARRETGEGR